MKSKMKLKRGVPLIDQHDQQGFWGGKFGGSFIPETLKKPVEDLTKEFKRLRNNKQFLKKRDYYFKNYIGSPTSFVKLENLSKHLGGAQIWAKVVSEANGGAHKIYNATVHALICKAMGKKYIVGDKYKGIVTNMADYGAFVEVDGGLEGLVHVSEMSWVSKIQKPENYVSIGDELEVMVLELDIDKKRLSLGIKQCVDNPWENFASSNPVGTKLKGEIKNITEFGLFIGLDGDIDGMVHLSDISWDKSGEEAIKDFVKGQTVEAKVIDIDVEKERVSLSVKDLADDPFTNVVKSLKRGSIVTAIVTAVQENGIEVEHEGLKSFIRKGDLSRDRSEQRSERFAVGNKLDARVTNIEKNNRKMINMLKKYELSEKDQIKLYKYSKKLKITFIS